MAKYALPRFMSRPEWEGMSADNRYWIESAGKWAKLYPGEYGSNWSENWGVMNFDHPGNKVGPGESIYTYGKRIYGDYRKLYGVPEC